MKGSVFYSEYSTVIFGCGNTLLGDDGFGPSVIKALHASYNLPETIKAVDVGTGIREHLLDFLLSAASRPEELVVIDAMDVPNLTPGMLHKLDPAAIPASKIHDFSLHQFPTINLLRELALETTTRITLLTVQIQSIPNTVCPGLSPEVAAAVPAACRQLCGILPELRFHERGAAA